MPEMYVYFIFFNSKLFSLLFIFSLFCLSRMSLFGHQKLKNKKVLHVHFCTKSQAKYLAVISFFTDPGSFCIKPKFNEQRAVWHHVGEKTIN